MLQFSVVQEKEIIEAESGKFIGYIVDAEVNEATGHIEYFFVSRPKKIYQFGKEEKTIKRIAVKDIIIIGQDIILIKQAF